MPYYFNLQWHITTKCNNNCKHCYMKDDKTYQNEVNNQLEFNDYVKILNNYKVFCDYFGFKGGITLTGGDPLLNSNLFDLLGLIKIYGFYPVTILGNPELITKEVARDLKRLGVTRYQMSLDGDKELHDSFRSEGSFDRTLKAFEILNDAEIITISMSTISELNIDKIIEVMDIVYDNKINWFDFARLVQVGNGSSLDVVSPERYKKFLNEIYNNYLKYQGKNNITKLGFKDHLWKLYFYEKNNIEMPKVNSIYSGCEAGHSHLTVLSNGEIFPCRRLPVTLGYAHKDNLIDIFTNNKILKELRLIKSFEKCNNCELGYFCRGCPAVAYASTGKISGIDPQCWYNL